MEKKIVVCWLLCAVLQMTGTPCSAQNTTKSPETTTTTVPPRTRVSKYRTVPKDVQVAVGEPVTFKCGVSEDSQNLTFTLRNSHETYRLTCPGGKVEDIPQAIYGSCEVKKGELLAIWTIKGTSFSDNNTRVICQESQSPNGYSAVLHIYDNGASYATLIGCLIGGFFGVLLVFGLIFLLLPKSVTLQNCFAADDTEDDLDRIVKE